MRIFCNIDEESREKLSEIVKITGQTRIFYYQTVIENAINEDYKELEKCKKVKPREKV